MPRDATKSAPQAPPSKARKSWATIGELMEDKDLFEGAKTLFLLSKGGPSLENGKALETEIKEVTKKAKRAVKEGQQRKEDRERKNALAEGRARAEQLSLQPEMTGGQVVGGKKRPVSAMISAMLARAAESEGPIGKGEKDEETFGMSFWRHESGKSIRRASKKRVRGGSTEPEE